MNEQSLELVWQPDDSVGSVVKGRCLKLVGEALYGYHTAMKTVEYGSLRFCEVVARQEVVTAQRLSECGKSAKTDTRGAEQSQIVRHMGA